MAAQVVRSSKFRHVYCDPPRPDATFSNLRLSTVTGEQNYIKANAKYFALGLEGGGGPLGIFDLKAPKRFGTAIPHFAGHSAPVLDFDFYPFSDNLIASASEDTTIKLWEIPEEGLTKVINTPLVSMSGHHKKVTLINWHPTAANVLGSVSADNTVKIWDVERGGEVNTLEGAHDQLIQDFAWDFKGNSYATSCKDKNVRIVDARTASVSGTIEMAHDGSKSVKIVYLGATDKLATVGFSRTSVRQLKIWDPRNLSAEVTRHEMDQAAGVIMPFYDVDTNLLFLAGKGDGNVRCFEISPTGEVFGLSEFRSSVSAKGIAMVPKRGLNVMGNEVVRLLKLTTNSVEPLSFIVPRKADGFQEDIYPDTFSGVPSHSAEEWLGGSDLAPLTTKVLGGTGTSAEQSPKAGGVGRTHSFKSSAALQAELERAHERIKVLEERLANAGLSVE